MEPPAQGSALRHESFVGLALLAATLVLLLVTIPSADASGELEEAGRLQALGRWAASESLATATLRRLESGPRADSLAIAQALYLISHAKWMNGSRLVADADVQASARCLAIRQRRLGLDGQPVAEAHTVVAALLRRRGRADSALAHSRRALEIRRARATPGDTLTADAWYQLGQTHRDRSDDRSALDAFHEALRIREHVHGSDHASVADLEAWIGDAWYRLGDRARARLSLEQSLATFDRIGGRDHALRWHPLNALSSVESSEGNPGRALDLLHEALRVIRLTGGEDSRDGLIARGNLGIRLLDLGDAAGARMTMTPLLPAFEGRFGRKSSNAASVRQVLAASCASVGDTATAMRLFVESESLLTAPGREPHPNLPLGLRWQAQLLYRQGRHAEARAKCERSIALARAAHSSLQRGEILSASYQILTRILAELGDVAALDSARRELASITEDYQLGGTGTGATTLYHRALAARRLGLHDEAWTEALEADRITRERVRRNIRALPDRRSLELSRWKSLHHDLVLELSRGGGPDRMQTAWDRLVRIRGLASAEVTRRRAPRA